MLQAGGKTNPLTSVLEGDTPPPIEEGWNLIEESLREARDLALARRFRLIVFPLPVAHDFRHVGRSHQRGGTSGNRRHAGRHDLVSFQPERDGSPTCARSVFC